MTIIAGKKTKAALIVELLEQGKSVKDIRKLTKASEGYIYQVKAVMQPRPKHEPEVLELTKEMEVVDETSATLDERGQTYGSFMAGADIAIRLKGIIHNAVARNDLHLFPDQMLALDMIAVKISRIVNGNPNHRDSWLDIAGYARLVADRLGGNQR